MPLDQYKLLGIELNVLIERNLTYLPTVFSESESVELIASVIRNLMRFGNQVDPENKEEKPSSQLDRLVPGWREQFPIPLDNDTGKELLDNWLEQASNASQSIKNQQTNINCNHVLDINTLKIKTQITLPKSFVFDLTRSEVSSTRLEFGIDEGVRKVAQLGSVFAQFEGRRCTIRPRSKKLVVERVSPSTPLFAELSETGICRDRQEIRASAIPVGDTPIGFEKIDDRFTYCGQSSFSVKAKTIYILISANSDLEVLSGSIELIETFSHQCTDLKWYQVNGEIRVHDNGNHYRIRTNSTNNSSGAFELFGQELQWETRPTRVYKGLPKVIVSDEENQSASATTEFINGKPRHVLKDHEQYGINTFSLKNAEGDVLLKRKLGILPEDLELNFHTDQQRLELHIQTEATIFADVMVEDMQCEHLKDGQKHVYSLSIKDKPPSHIRLLVYANLASDPIEIILPFPAAGVFGFDNNGQELNQSLTIPQLLGSELLLYSAKDYVETFTVSVSLRPITRNSPRFESKIKVGNRPISVSLYSFKERILELFALCALEEGIDAEVEIEIRHGTNSKKFVVRKFVTEIEIDTTHNIVSFHRDSIVDTYDEKPHALLIAEPERHCEPLPPKMLGGIELDRYELLPAMLKGDSWMIIPGHGNDLAFRPRLVCLEGDKGRQEAGVDSVHTLQSAVRAYHPVSNPDVIAHVISEMAENIEHHSWGYLTDLWKETNYLPLATFKVWNELAKNERALALALFVFEMNEDFIRKLDIELPIFWEMISLNGWKSAISQYRTFIGRFLSDQEVLSARIQELLSNLTSCVSSFPAPLADYLIHEKFETKLDKEQANVLVNQCWIQQLRQDNADAIWPDMLNLPLSKAAEQCGVDEFLACEPYQVSVIYYPAVSAAVATGIIRLEDFIRLEINAIFELKKLRDFDRDWFSAAFSYFVSVFETQNKGNE